jgi:hypothetical protein
VRRLRRLASCGKNLAARARHAAVVSPLLSSSVSMPLSRDVADVSSTMLFSPPPFPSFHFRPKSSSGRCFERPADLLLIPCTPFQAAARALLLSFGMLSALAPRYYLSDILSTASPSTRTFSSSSKCPLPDTFSPTARGANFCALGCNGCRATPHAHTSCGSAVLLSHGSLLVSLSLHSPSHTRQLSAI